MLKSYKYRIYPDEHQKILMNKHFNACRFVYNLALETKIAAYSCAKKNLNRYDLQVQLKDLKKECIWLSEINSQSLQFVLMKLDSAYLNFFKGINKFPKFKKKNNYQSFNCPQTCYVIGGKLKIPKFKKYIKIKQHRLFSGNIKNVTISKTTTDKYFASILVEDGAIYPLKKEINSYSTIGIDLGIKTFAVCSDGIEYENPKFLKNNINRLKVLKKRTFKKKLNSNNYKKASKKLAALHEKIANKRKDYLHKTSAAIIKRVDSVAIESLAINDMMSHKGLAKHIQDASWSSFIYYLKYKSNWYGKNIIVINRFEPTSKIHNYCGYLNKKLKLSDREWVCPNCNKIVYRDLNASINIKNIALKQSGQEMSAELVEPPTLVGVMKQEVYCNKKQ